ncbi:magnesium transporter CorA family protein [Tamaricihabitans halophyticus]|uniref:magnesium transporter CorA family protein n=1 Tax=Tamaricihabitans halophyticus TaxID=1262583 RepID=UPI00311DC55E
MLSSRMYRDGTLRDSDFPLDTALRYLRDERAVVWLDLPPSAAAELRKVSAELDLHRLAVEDALGAHQRPKLERYDTHAFLVTYGMTADPATSQLTATELSVFITERALITVRQNDNLDAGEFGERWDTTPELAGSGVAFLLHGVLDYVVDQQLAAVQELDTRIEELEDLVFTEHADNTAVQRRWLRLRKSVSRARRILLPMREALTSLLRREHTVFDGSGQTDSQLLPFFQDVYDHVVHAAELSESLREHVTTIREAQLNVQSNRLNTIMKKVTSWAAIIAVPTGITGFYGMNVPYPGFQATFGFWTALVAIVLLPILLYTLFKGRDWL